MGRHSKLSKRKTTVGRLVARGALAVALPGAAFMFPGVAQAAPAPAGVDWGPIIACESGGQGHNIPNSGGGSSASGYLQITVGTWRDYGGLQFAPNAMGATRAQQLLVGDRIFADRGLAPWAASENCWGGKVNTHAAPPTVRASAALPAAVPAPHPALHPPAAQPAPHPAPRIVVPQPARHASGATGTSSGRPGRHRAPQLQGVPEHGAYTVRAGDTLSQIALASHDRWPDLAAANHLADPNLILVDQVLQL
jgi:hypothetical protein